jgi:hypothetical protein
MGSADARLEVRSALSCEAVLEISGSFTFMRLQSSGDGAHSVTVLTDPFTGTTRALPLAAADAVAATAAAVRFSFSCSFSLYSVAVAMPSNTIESFVPAPSTVEAAAKRFLNAADRPAKVEFSSALEVSIGRAGGAADVSIPAVVVGACTPGAGRGGGGGIGGGGGTKSFGVSFSLNFRVFCGFTVSRTDCSLARASGFIRSKIDPNFGGLLSLATEAVLLVVDEGSASLMAAERALAASIGAVVLLL